jgi:hypothetical protein
MKPEIVIISTEKQPEPNAEPEISVAELKKKISGMSKEDMAIMLSREKSGSNRISIVKILEKGLKE